MCLWCFLAIFTGEEQYVSGNSSLPSSHQNQREWNARVSCFNIQSKLIKSQFLLLHKFDLLIMKWKMYGLICPGVASEAHIQNGCKFVMKQLRLLQQFLTLLWLLMRIYEIIKPHNKSFEMPKFFSDKCSPSHANHVVFEAFHGEDTWERGLAGPLWILFWKSDGGPEKDPLVLDVSIS